MTKKGKKPNLVEEAPNSTISEREKNIDTVNKIDKSQAPQKTVDTSNINKTDIVRTMDKSGSTKITDKVYAIYKSMSIPGTNLSNRSTEIENPTEIYIVKENTFLSSFSLQGHNLADIIPDILRIQKNLFYNQSTLDKGQKRII